MYVAKVINISMLSFGTTRKRKTLMGWCIVSIDKANQRLKDAKETGYGPVVLCCVETHCNCNNPT